MPGRTSVRPGVPVWARGTRSGDRILSTDLPPVRTFLRCVSDEHWSWWRSRSAWYALRAPSACTGSPSRPIPTGVTGADRVWTPLSIRWWDSVSIGSPITPTRASSVTAPFAFVPSIPPGRRNGCDGRSRRRTPAAFESWSSPIWATGVLVSRGEGKSTSSSHGISIDSSRATRGGSWRSPLRRVMRMLSVSGPNSTGSPRTRTVGVR